MKERVIKTNKPRKSNVGNSKIKTVMTKLSKMNKPFHRSKIVELGMNQNSENLIKHFFLEKDIRVGYWKFSQKKIEARGYKSLKDLYNNEGFFRVDLVYLLKTKNGKRKSLSKVRKVSDKDKKISENLFNITYSS